MKKFLKSREGFTLIELLVVIAIIGILAAVVVLAINPVEMMRKGRDSNRESDMATLSKALDIYIVDSQLTGAAGIPGDNGQTSNTSDCCNGGAGNCTDPTDADTGGWLEGYAVGCGFDISTYISQIPTDPIDDDTNHYTYYNNTTTDKYCLRAVYESTANGTNYDIGSDIDLCP